MALLIPFRGKRPSVAPGVFLAPTAVLIGDVRVEEEASVWFGAVLRGDDPENGIVVGPRSSVQDNCVIHVGTWAPTLIGEGATIGHGASMESCTIGQGTLVGMNAVILPNVTLGRDCLVAASSVVLEGMQVPDGSLVAGVPARIRKTVAGSAAGWLGRSTRHYVELSREYLAEGVDRISERGPGRLPDEPDSIPRHAVGEAGEPI